MELNRIYNEDCLIGMDRIADESIDMILCDLPYGTTQNKWDSVIDLNEMWAHYSRIITDKGAIVLTAQSPFDKVLGSSNLPLLKYEWIWVKPQGTGHLNSNKYPLKNHENILVFCKGVHHYNPQMTLGEIRTVKRTGNKSKTTNYGDYVEIAESQYNSRHPVTTLFFNQETGLHPTQKPVELFEYLILTYTNEGMTVLDNCMGSGTTAIACIKSKRNYIGFEMDKSYYDASLKRIEQFKQQTTLF